MPTRMPGGVFTSSADWATLLAHLESLRAAIEDSTATVAACDTRLQRLEGRVHGLEAMIGAPTWHREGHAPRPGLIAVVEALERRVAAAEGVADATADLLGK